MTTATLFDSARSPKALRSFGIGVVPATRWTGSYGWMPSRDDAAFAAQMFAMDATEPTDGEWDAIAADREHELAYYELTERMPACTICGYRHGEIADGVHAACEDMISEASVASGNYAAGLGYRVW